MLFGALRDIIGFRVLVKRLLEFKYFLYKYFRISFNLVILLVTF